MPSLSLYPLLVSALLTAPAVPDRVPAQAGSIQVDSLPRNDAMTLSKMHLVNLTEIEIGGYAAEHARRSDLKKYGQMLVRDHSSNDQKVMTLARELGTRLPSLRSKADSLKPDIDKDRMTAERLKHMSSATFDTAFVRTMEQGHQQALNTLEAARSQVTNSKLRSLVEATIPTIREHLEKIRNLSGGETAARGRR